MFVALVVMLVLVLVLVLIMMLVLVLVLVLVLILVYVVVSVLLCDGCFLYGCCSCIVGCVGYCLLAWCWSWLRLFATFGVLIYIGVCFVLSLGCGVGCGFRYAFCTLF